MSTIARQLPQEPTLEQKLALCTSALAAGLPVREIWLFGSQARGDARPDSDIDLLAVLDDDHGIQRPHLAARRCINRIEGIPRIESDVLVLPEMLWKEKRAKQFGIWGDIAREGKIIYARN